MRTFLPDPYVPENPYVIGRCHALTAPVAGTLVAVANTAHYVPVVFPCDATLYAIHFGCALADGNYDLGLYDETLTRLASSGSTALSAVGTKTLTLSELRVKGGRVYFGALAFSSTTAQAYRPATGAAINVSIGAGQEASALPLPATATPVAPSTTVVPFFTFGVR